MSKMIKVPQLFVEKKPNCTDLADFEELDR